MIQRVVKIGTVVETDSAALLDKLKLAAQQANALDILEGLNTYAGIERKLKVWVDSPEYGVQRDLLAQNNPQNKRSAYKAHYRYYDTYLELAHALVGHVASSSNRKMEKMLALKTFASPHIDKCLNTICAKLCVVIENSSQIKEEFELGVVKYGASVGEKFGTYTKYEQQRKKNYPPIYEVLKDAPSKSQGLKVAAIHDVMEYFKPAHPREPTTVGTGLIKPPSISPYARTNSARLEFSNDTLTSRKNKMPVESGLSNTTLRMLSLAKTVGADNSCIEALAWGIFAYWKLIYDKVATGKHTFDEVMLPANLKFGVEYKRYYYPENPPPNCWSGRLFAAADAPVALKRPQENPNVKIARRLHVLAGHLKPEEDPNVKIARRLHVLAGHLQPPEDTIK